MVGLRMSALALALASIVTSSPCPFGQMHEEGKLNAEDSDSFLKAREFGEDAVENMIHFSKKTKRTPEDQNEYYKRQSTAGLLPLGGGLLNGALQPFTGRLANLDVPTPQQFSLEIIPDKVRQSSILSY